MIYLFFDEVTSKKSYQQELKNLYDLGGVKIFASASLLKDSQAFLTGRQRLVDVMPLSFEEYLQFKNIVIKKADEHLIESYFEEYMKDGDIAYHKIKDEQMVKDFFKLLMEHSGKQLSLNQI